MSRPYTPRVGRRAARVIADEFIRQPGSKTGLLLHPAPADPLLAATVDALLPGDKLTVVLRTGVERDAVESFLADQGSWVADRVSVVSSTSEAAPADVVMLAEPVADEAEQFDATATMLRELTAPGGVLTMSAPLTSPAAEAIAEFAAEYGVSSDLVLLNRPPLRIHRLRFTEARVPETKDIEPSHRPSSVPVTSRMNIDSNGLAAGAICLGLAGATKKLRPKSKLWLVPAMAAGPVAAFFRDPQRDINDDQSAVVASGDGKVLSVERIIDDRFAGGASDEWLRIAVFLSILDVHVNRSPVAGKVVDTFREDGSNAPAMRPDAEHNVACYTVLDTTHGRVAVAQRTGMVARRIINRSQPGALLAKGERYGLIRFGSRTDVYLPADTVDAAVAPGESVVAGETVIARWR